MAKFYTATCDHMGSNYTKHNKIAKIFNNSAAIQNWISPQDGHFLIKVTDETRASEVRDMITNAADVTTFVTPLNPNTYAYSLRQKNCHKVDAWLEKHTPPLEKTSKIEPNGCIALSGEFQNQTIKLDNGCTINIHENGEIHIEEKGKKPHKVRNRDDITGQLIF